MKDIAGIRLLHIVPTAIRGGCEMNCYRFIKAMPSIQQKVVVLGETGPMVAEWQSLSVSVDVLDIMKLSLFKFRNALINALPEESFDHVIVWTNSRINIVANALNKYKASLYFHIGNPVLLTPRQEIQIRITSLMFPISNPINLRPVSRFVQQGLSKSGFYKRFPSKVSLKPIESSEQRVKPPVEITNAPVLGMVARLDKIKDHETVIKAFKNIRQSFSLAKLHLAGDGDKMGSLKTLASSLDLNDSVVFHGDVKNVAALMKDWDLFLYGTTEREGLGGTVPEALSMGLPVVATDLPMVREWDPTEKFISYVKYADANDMAKKSVDLLKNVSRRREIYDQSPLFIKQHYSPQRFAMNYIDIQES